MFVTKINVNLMCFNIFRGFVGIQTIDVFKLDKFCMEWIKYFLEYTPVMSMLLLFFWLFVFVRTSYF